MTTQTSRDPESRRAALGDTPPACCPTCAHPLSEYPYYQEVPRPSVRTIRRFAWRLLPTLAVTVLLGLLAGKLLFHSGVSFYVYLSIVCLPSLVLFWLTRYVPPDHRILCLRCSWYRDYPQPWLALGWPEPWWTPRRTRRGAGVSGS